MRLPVHSWGWQLLASLSHISAAGPGLSSESDSRTEGRSNVFLSAMLHTGERSIPVRVRNISRRGALIDGHALPSIGTTVRLSRGRLSASGELVWEVTGQAGVTFGHEIDVEEWVQRIVHAGQQRVDGVVAALRRSAPIPEALRDTSSAGSLPVISAALDEVCERLAAMPDLPLHLGEELLRLDAIAHSLRLVATKN